MWQWDRYRVPQNVFLFYLSFWDIAYVHLCAKFDVYSFTRFDDMFEVVLRGTTDFAPR